MVIQTNVLIEPVSLVFICNGEVGNGDITFGSDSGAVFTNSKIGVIPERPTAFVAVFQTPPFVPEKPMSVWLYSKSKISVVDWGTLQATD